MNKTFCAFPYVHIHVRPNGKIKPCHRFLTLGKFEQFDINKGDDPLDALNSPQWKKLRSDMLAGEQNPGCYKCYEEEEAGGRSMRMSYNDRFFPDITSDALPLKSIEIGFGNYCNLACRMCNSQLSSTWAEEDEILAPLYNRINAPAQLDNPFFWNADNLKDIEEIKFTGGEPMLHPNFKRLLNLIVDLDKAKNITLNIYTNTSWTPKPRLIELLLRFSRVNLHLSIDGLGRVNDYIRFPSKWPAVQESTSAWLAVEARSPTTFRVKWTPVLSLYNILQYPDMVSWWAEQRKELGLTYSDGSLSASIGYIHEPVYLVIGLLPKPALADVLDDLRHRVRHLPGSNESSLFEDSFIDGVETVAAIPPKACLEDFASYTADLDHMRNQRMEDALPELYNVLGPLRYERRNRH